MTTHMEIFKFLSGLSDTEAQKMVEELHREPPPREDRFTPEQIAAFVAQVEPEALREAFAEELHGSSYRLETIFDACLYDPGGCHEWRNYIPFWADDRGVWVGLSPSMKAAIYLTAEHQAGNEDWD